MFETIWLFQNEEYFKCFEPNILSECDSRKNAFDLFYFSTKVASTDYPDHNVIYSLSQTACSSIFDHYLERALQMVDILNVIRDFLSCNLCQG